MEKHDYIAKRNFQSLEPGGNLIHAGDTVTVRDKKTVKHLQSKGLIYPKYSTKEDKKALKVNKKYRYLQNGSWFTVYKGDEQVDKFQGKEGLKEYGLDA